jgi:polynucleotide 5'-hydroxyl-kinase GRC3/NOL9
VEGPASLRLVSGKAEMFSHQLKETVRIVVREGKRLPFFVLEKAIFDLSLGPNATIQDVGGSTIPPSWNIPLEAISGMPKRPLTVLILGKIDSGKSSYCNYLVNKLVDGKCRVAVLDGDIGHSDIGSSGTVAYATTSKQITELYNVKFQNAFFVGTISPITALPKTIEALAIMKDEILNKNVDFILVNTDGWVTSDIAVRYKTALVNEVKPDIIVGLQVENELEPLIANLDSPVIMVEPSPSLTQRTAEKRKVLREMTYSKYLKGAKQQFYYLSQVTIEPRNALPKNQAPEKGLLVGLYGSGNKFLGIGILREINQTRKALKVQTSVSAKPSRIVLGKVVLDKKFREI